MQRNGAIVTTIVAPVYFAPYKKIRAGAAKAVATACKGKEVRIR
jgi:hypothetical protein